MSQIESWKTDVVDNIFSRVGIVATVEQIKMVAIHFDNELHVRSEQSSYAHIDKSIKDCEKCKELKSRISKLEKENLAYNNCVKTKLKADEVIIEGDKVLYR